MGSIDLLLGYDLVFSSGFFLGILDLGILEFVNARSTNRGHQMNVRLRISSMLSGSTWSFSLSILESGVLPLLEVRNRQDITDQIGNTLRGRQMCGHKAN